MHVDQREAFTLTQTMIDDAEQLRHWPTLEHVMQLMTHANRTLEQAVTLLAACKDDLPQAFELVGVDMNEALEKQPKTCLPAIDEELLDTVNALIQSTPAYIPAQFP
jgi:uncharacterized membrane protein YccC